MLSAQDKAEDLLLSVSAHWNAGIFLWSAQAVLSTLERHAPDILQSCQQGFALHLNNTFVQAPHRPVESWVRKTYLSSSPDALSVAASIQVEQVKRVVTRVDADNISQSVQHRKVA